MPRHSICSRWVDDEPVVERAHASVKPVPSYPGVRSPPLRGGGQAKARRPYEGKPGDDAKGGFSEGRTLCVRFARPHECQDIAFPPGAFTIAPQSKRGMLGLARCFPLRACGARPSAGGQAQDRWPRGEGPEMARKAVFSEGRTLCVRVVRPHECQDIAFPPGAFTIAPQSKRGMLGLARCFPLRACGARPSAGRPIQDRGGLTGQTRR
jgi:hypothetical protein